MKGEELQAMRQLIFEKAIELRDAHIAKMEKKKARRQELLAKRNLGKKAQV